MPRYVEKTRVPVCVHLPGEDGVLGFLSLMPSSEHHAGPETILDRLNENTRVVPFQRAGDGAVLLLNRSRIDWIEAGAEVPPVFLRSVTYAPTREEHVQVRLTSGATFDGIMPMEMPDEYNRASDYLNGEPDFFVLVCGRVTRIVNKEHVLETRVYGSTLRPAENAA